MAAQLALFDLTAHLQHIALRGVPLAERAADAEGTQNAIAVQVAVRFGYEAREPRPILRVELKGVGVRRVESEVE